MVSGLVCSFAGVLYTFRLSTSVANNGVGLELDVVAIVLVGGVSIFGGKGSVPGVVLGVLAFAGIQNALLLTNFNQEASGIVAGGLLLVSVFLPNAASAVAAARRPHPRSRPRRGHGLIGPTDSPVYRQAISASRKPKLKGYQTMRLRRATWLALPLLLVAPALAACSLLLFDSPRPRRPRRRPRLPRTSSASTAPLRQRQSEDRPQGLRDPEEPRQLLLHHLRQRELRRRAGRAADAGRDRDGDAAAPPTPRRRRSPPSRRRSARARTRWSSPRPTPPRSARRSKPP